MLYLSVHIYVVSLRGFFETGNLFGRRLLLPHNLLLPERGLQLLNVTADHIISAPHLRLKKAQKKRTKMIPNSQFGRSAVKCLKWLPQYYTCTLRKWFSLLNEWLREGVFSWLPPRILRPFFFSLRAPCWWRRILSSCSSTLILVLPTSRSPNPVWSTALLGRSCTRNDSVVFFQALDRNIPQSICVSMYRPWTFVLFLNLWVSAEGQSVHLIPVV